MTALPVPHLDALVDAVVVDETARMVLAAEGAFVKCLRAELLDDEIAELVAVYLTVAERTTFPDLDDAAPPNNARHQGTIQ